jgi:hypothetical protein
MASVTQQFITAITVAQEGAKGKVGTRGYRPGFAATTRWITPLRTGKALLSE